MSNDDRPWDRGRDRGRPDPDDPDDPDDRGRPADGDYDDPRPRRRRPPPEQGNGLAVAGLVLGILSLCGCFALTGIPAIILSVIAMQRPSKKGMATAGVVLGGIGTVATILLPALLLPAVQKVREAAARAKDTNSMKQIALGFNTYHDVNARFPPATGNLSWRVHILPYIEQGNLHRLFNTDEPWDGPTNRRLAAERVQSYTSSLDPNSPDTRYRVFVGPGTLYDPALRIGIGVNGVTDGTSNTVFAVEAAEAVPWPQPKELPYTPNGSLPELGHPGRNGFLVVMTDGAVRFVRKGADDRILRAAITPNGGEQVPLWDE